MTTTQTRRANSYLAAFAILADPAQPHETPPTIRAVFDTLHNALTWLRERAHSGTSSSGLAAAAVYSRSPDRDELVPIHRFGVGTRTEIAYAAQVTMTIAPAPPRLGGSAPTTAAIDDPACAAADALDQARATGLRIQFTDAAEPSRILLVGMIDREWMTIEYRLDDAHGGELREIGHVGVPHYARVTDMLGDLAIGAPYRGTGRVGQHLPPVNVPDDVVQDLSTYQARLDVLAARARMCACDHPEILPISPHGAGPGTEPATAPSSPCPAEPTCRPTRRTARGQTRRKARL